MKKTVLLMIALLCATVSFAAYTERNLLLSQADINTVKEALVMNQKWVAYPDYTDRKGWDNFLGNAKGNYIRRGEKRLNYSWKVVKASDYLEFERSGNRRIMEDPFFENNTAVAELLMAELAEGKGRFMDQLVNGVFFLCEMTSWANSAHVILQKSHRAFPSHDNPVFDLSAGGIGNMLSWTYYFMHDSFDKIDPEISRRLRHELQVRILDTYLNDDSFWWMARNYKKGRMLNNWNPWCNSNALMCFMLLEDNRDTLAKAVYMSMESVDKFLNYIKADGACEEGPSYWGHAYGKTFDYLDMLATITGGKVNIFSNTMIRNMGEYISRSYVGNGWVVNFADASAKGGGDPYLIYRYGKAVDSDEMKGFAALLKKEHAVPWYGEDIYRTLASVQISENLQQTAPSHANRSFTWYPETEFCYLTTKEGIFLAAKGGYNDESHNHNDVGSCTVWMDHTPILIDAGVGTYTRQTFSSERYSIWTMQSNYHNLPLINGIAQKNGRRFKAMQVKAGNGRFEANLATAYPEEAQVQKWIRSYRLNGRQIRIQDTFRLKQAVAPNIINFMTWGKIDYTEKGKVYIEVDGVKALLQYDDRKFDLAVESVKQVDARLSSVWGNTLYRLSFKAKAQVEVGNYSFTLNKM